MDPKNISTAGEPRPPSGGKVATDRFGAAAEAAAPGLSDSAWQPAVTALRGIPLEVRSADGREGIAIADEYVGWFNADRSGPPDFTPAEWRRPTAG